jgi:tetrahydromethanopterin S-methyltransferase subunit B
VVLRNAAGPDDRGDYREDVVMSKQDRLPPLAPPEEGFPTWDEVASIIAGLAAFAAGFGVGIIGMAVLIWWRLG